MKAKPILAVVGRPNVGKSTFFNRIIGERKAIVQIPGVTRTTDLRTGTEWNGRSSLLSFRWYRANTKRCILSDERKQAGCVELQMLW